MHATYKRAKLRRKPDPLEQACNNYTFARRQEDLRIINAQGDTFNNLLKGRLLVLHKCHSVSWHVYKREPGLETRCWYARTSPRVRGEACTDIRKLASECLLCQDDKINTSTSDASNWGSEDSGAGNSPATSGSSFNSLTHSSNSGSRRCSYFLKCQTEYYTVSNQVWFTQSSKSTLSICFGNHVPHLEGLTTPIWAITVSQK